MTLQLTQVALALEHGHLLVLLFPQQLLDALHAVLNADYGRSELSASTLSYNAIHRDVIVKVRRKRKNVWGIVVNLHPCDFTMETQYY